MDCKGMPSNAGSMPNYQQHKTSSQPEREQGGIRWCWGGLALRRRAFDAVRTFVVIKELIDFGSWIFVDVDLLLGLDLSLFHRGFVVWSAGIAARWRTNVSLRPLDDGVVESARRESWEKETHMYSNHAYCLTVVRGNTERTVRHGFSHA